MAVPARIPLAIALDANGNGSTQVIPYTAYWATLALTLRAATLSSPVFDVSIGVDPILYASGQRAELGPFITSPQDSVTITVSNGAANDTVQGTLWGVQASSQEEAAAALQGVMANGYMPPTRLRVFSGMVAVASSIATFTLPLPASAVGLIVVPSSGLAPQIADMTAQADQTLTALPGYTSGGMYCFDIVAGAGQSGSIGTPTYDAQAKVTITAPGAGVGPWRVTAFAVFAGGMPPRPSLVLPGIQVVQGVNLQPGVGASVVIVPGIAGQTIRLYRMRLHAWSALSAAYGTFKDTNGQDKVFSINCSQTNHWEADFDGHALPHGAGFQLTNDSPAGFTGINGMISFTQQ